MTKKERQIVFDKYGGKCAYCGCELQSGWHVDHLESIQRYKHGGCINKHLDCIDNMMPSCPSCNINKHGDSIEQFRLNIKGYLNSLNLRMVQYKMVKKYGLVEETNKPVTFYFETIK